MHFPPSPPAPRKSVVKPVAPRWILRRARLSLCLMCLGVMSAGCTIGYRYHHVDGAVESESGMRGHIEGGGHVVELGVVLDFRYLRLLMPFLGGSYDLALEADAGTRAQRFDTFEKRGYRLDLPVLSLWNERGGIEPGYPGVMVHRESVELWLSATAHAGPPMLGFADLGVVYYQHNLVAVRAFGGWGVAPFRETTGGFGPGGRVRYDTWKTSAGGLSGGIELTLGAGEQALDFLKFFLSSQKAVEDEMR